MEKDKISIVMSAYNAEGTIERAIRSIENNSYKNLEIVICDDCSTDNTKDIVRNLMKVYPNIVLVEHSINLGAGYARRSGIENSTGDYIGFVDSDDEISRDFYSILFKYLKKHDADIVWSSPLIIHSSSQKIRPKVYGEEIHIGDDIVRKDIDRKKFFVGSLSKKELWNNIRYSSLRYIEDTPTMYRLLHYCNKGVMLDYKGYFYYQNPKSLCHQADDLKNSIYKTLCVIEMLEFDELNRGLINKKAFVIVFKELSNILKSSSIKDTIKYKKELFRIYQYFTLKIL